MHGLAGAAIGLALLLASAALALGVNPDAAVAQAQVVPTGAPTLVPTATPRAESVTPIATRPAATPTATPGAAKPATPTPLANPTTGIAPPSAVSSSSQLPTFVLGFAFLKDQLGPIMGVPLEQEHGSADSCDTRQRTSTGLAYWRCSINAMAFAAAPDGLQHWAWMGRLVSWVGASADPPGDALVVVPLIVTTPPPDASCTTPAEGPVAACALIDGLTLPGWIQAAGGTNAYRFTIQPPATHMVAQLTDLPADYDLYLTDVKGVVVGESVLEGTIPREIDMTLTPGVYYLYVHDDPSRPVDPSSPFHIHLNLTAP